MLIKTELNVNTEPKLIDLQCFVPDYLCEEGAFGTRGVCAGGSISCSRRAC